MLAGNELICAKLLGWNRVHGGWIKSDGYMYGGCGTPSFTTWAEAGLILDAIQRLSYDRRTAADVLLKLGDLVIGALLTPTAIRAAALELIKAAKLMSDNTQLSSDPMATPKTDGAAVWGHDAIGSEYYVPADFARAQERRIAELTDEVMNLELGRRHIAELISGHEGYVFNDITRALGILADEEKP